MEAAGSSQLIFTLLAIFIAAFFGGIAAFKLKLPMLVGYIAAGIVVGNSVAGRIDMPLVRMIADSGVTLLLFTLGVEFSFRRLRKSIGVLLWAALVQIFFVAIVFLAFFMALGIVFHAALVFALAVSLSSTAVVVRILTERGELETVSGEVLTTWLVIQDLATIPIMMLLPSIIRTGADTGVATAIGSILIDILKSGLMIASVVFLGRVIVPKLLSLAASIGSREIFVIAVVGLVFLVGSAFSLSGLSPALGAFIAGLIVADTSENHAIFSEIRPLRDIFGVVFFVSIGLMLPIRNLIGSLPLLAVTIPAVFFVKFFIVYLLCRFLGYHRKTAFPVAIGLTQLSEFGFILAQQGVNLGALTEDQELFLIALAFASILIGSTLLPQATGLYRWLFRHFGERIPFLFGVKREGTMAAEQMDIHDHVVICGYGRVGKYVGRALQMAEIPFIVVEFDHAKVKTLRDHGIPVYYGDPADIDVLDCAQVDKARAIIIAIPDRHTQEMVVGNAFTLNKNIAVMCRSHHEEDQRRLKSLGVTTIIQPEFEAAVSIVHKLLPSFGIRGDELLGKVSRLKIEHGLG